MPVPVGLGQVERRLVPALGAEVSRQVKAGVFAQPAREVSHAQPGVLHPEPVAGQRGEAVQRVLGDGRRLVRGCFSPSPQWLSGAQVSPGANLLDRYARVQFS